MTSAAGGCGPADNLDIARDVRSRRALRHGPTAPASLPRVCLRPVPIPAIGRIPDGITGPVWETTRVPARRPADVRRCRDGDADRIAEVPQ